MKIIRPFPVTNVSLVSSTVSATDAIAVAGSYNAATTYAVGDIIQYDSPTFTFTASGATLTATAHGWLNGTQLAVSTSGTLPTGLVASTLYWVVEATTNTFKLSATKNGSPITTTGAGTGVQTATVSHHHIYESLVALNVGNTPHKSITQWLDRGATNRWKPFDQSVTSQVEQVDSISYVLQATGRVDSVALLNVSAASATISARVSTMATSATTDATGYAIGLSTVALAAAGTGAIAIGDVLSFAGQATLYTATTAVASVAAGGTVSFTPALVSTIPAALTAIAVTAYGPTTYPLSSSTTVSSYWSWFYEVITRKVDFVDVDFPPYNNLQVTVTLTDTGNTVKCGAVVLGLSKDLGYTQYGATHGITDYSVKTQDAFGNYNVTERAFRKRGSFQILVNRVGSDALQQVLEAYRATPVVYIGSGDYESTIIYGFYRDFTVNIAYPSHSICTIDVEGLT